MPITISDGTDSLEVSDVYIARCQQAIDAITARLPEAQRIPTIVNMVFIRLIILGAFRREIMKDRGEFLQVRANQEVDILSREVDGLERG